YHLLPYLEQQAIYDNMPGFNEYTELTWLDNNGDNVTVFGCPSDPAIGAVDSGGAGGKRPTTSYFGVRGIDRGGVGYPPGPASHANGDLTAEGILYWRSNTRIEEVSDGLSQTLLVGEHPATQADGGVAAGDWGWWYTTTS